MTKIMTFDCDKEAQSCIALAAQVIGAKWVSEVIFGLANGVRRFSELEKLVTGINPRTLSARLDELEEMKIISKKSYAEMPPRIEYTLTAKGHDLLPILEQMQTWGQKYPRAT